MTSPARRARFAAAVFDMDGLLVDSEPLWHEAEVEILGALGVPLRASDTRHTKGMYVGEVTRYWHARYPWAGPDPAAVAEAVVDAVGALVLAKGRLLTGATAALERCRAAGLPLALASSTDYRLIEVVLTHFSLADAFDAVHSAQDEPYGKPHPAVFLGAATKLGVDPAGCLVFEDAPAGVLAAKAARMACVAVPAASERRSPVMGIADAVLDSLTEFDDDLLAILAEAHLADPLAAPGHEGGLDAS